MQDPKLNGLPGSDGSLYSSPSDNMWAGSISVETN